MQRDLHSSSAAESETDPVAEVLVECGMCHRHRVPATWCHDSEDGEYAVCAECNAITDGNYPVADDDYLGAPPAPQHTEGVPV
jgi:hypothetical protein